jgi:hypothetical protein
MQNDQKALRQLANRSRFIVDMHWSCRHFLRKISKRIEVVSQSPMRCKVLSRCVASAVRLSLI